MKFFTALLLAAALSADGFGVGLAYGIRKIKVSFFSILLIIFCAVLAMTFSLIFGQLIAGFIPYHLTSFFGGSILVLFGFWQLLEGLKKYKDNPVLLTIKLKTFGLVLQIIREPENADMDRSGDINYKEALLLGIALNIDVAGVGLGAAMAGYSFILIPFVTIGLFFALYLGLIIGKKSITGFIGKKGYIIPGLVLMLLGLINYIR
ncbi:MAG: sporulation membrane protein YtaF [Firmicutes bacterium]|nr:sporulation membrane protein YtaF [Bacillota bacterium]